MTLVTRLDPWLPPLALMGLIFFLSAQPNLSSGLGTWDLVLRKGAHMTEYALLTFLWWRALRTKLAADTALKAAVAIAIGYSATDEFHQSFVTGRHGSPVDVLIDAIGALIAATLITRYAAHTRQTAR
jgi:VanZ family protein